MKYINNLMVYTIFRISDKINASCIQFWKLACLQGLEPMTVTLTIYYWQSVINILHDILLNNLFTLWYKHWLYVYLYIYMYIYIYICTYVSKRPTWTSTNLCEVQVISTVGLKSLEVYLWAQIFDSPNLVNKSALTLNELIGREFPLDDRHE